MTLALLLFGCWTAVVEPGLESFRTACASWKPYAAYVRSVRWCMPIECENMQVGNMFAEYRDRNEIVVSRVVPEDMLDLTLVHEYGHALGLQHLPVGIMKKDWTPPVADGPEQSDFDAIARLWRAR